MFSLLLFYTLIYITSVITQTGGSKICFTDQRKAFLHPKLAIQLLSTDAIWSSIIHQLSPWMLVKASSKYWGECHIDDYGNRIVGGQGVDRRFYHQTISTEVWVYLRSD